MVQYPTPTPFWVPFISAPNLPQNHNLQSSSTLHISSPLSNRVSQNHWVSPLTLPFLLPLFLSPPPPSPSFAPLVLRPCFSHPPTCCKRLSPFPPPPPFLFPLFLPPPSPPYPLCLFNVCFPVSLFFCQFFYLSKNKIIFLTPLF